MPKNKLNKGESWLHYPIDSKVKDRLKIYCKKNGSIMKKVVERAIDAFVKNDAQAGV